MSQMNTNGRTGRGLLEQGGITGALVGGFLGGSEGAAKGYATVANLRGLEQGMRLTEDQNQRSEETHSVDLMTKYADLRMKSRDLKIKDMHIEVLEANQQGHIDNGALYSKRASAKLQNSGVYTKIDANNAVKDLVQSYSVMDDAQRQFVASRAGIVKDAQTHAQSVAQVKQFAEAIGVPFEKFGISEEWQGEKKTVAEWNIVADTALASQEMRETFATEAYKTNLTMGRDAILSDQQFARDKQNFIYDMEIAKYREQAANSRAQLAALAESGGSIKRSDLTEQTVQQIAGGMAIQLGDMIQFSGDETKEGVPKDLLVAADTAANEVDRRVDASWRAHARDSRISPITQSEARAQVIQEYQGLTGTDGKLYEPTSNTLRAQRIEWQNTWLQEVAKVKPEVMQLTPNDLKNLLDRAWGSPQERRSARQGDTPNYNPNRR